MIKAKHYLELHITVEASDNFGHFRKVVENYSSIEWKASRFAEDDVDGMHNKWFCSARVTHFQTVFPALVEMSDILKANDYQVLRAKAEDTIFDTKCGDKLG